MVKLVGSGLLEKEGKFLLVQENKEIAKGMWEFPGGGIEDNENIYEGVIREVKEETGYDVKIKRFFRIFHTKSNSGNQLILLLFECEIIGGEEIESNEEIMSLKWVSKEELINMDLRGEYIKDAIESYGDGFKLIDYFEVQNE